jgi:PD-(D/E)XK endonuclease
MQWLAGRGAKIAYPVGHSEHWDFVAELEGVMLRVQVKTCTFQRHERWEVAVCTRGGNQSWSGLVKRLDCSRFDYLFVHVGDDRRWFIPADRLEGGTKIRLGGRSTQSSRSSPVRLSLARRTPRSSPSKIRGRSGGCPSG